MSWRGGECFFFSREHRKSARENFEKKCPWKKKVPVNIFEKKCPWTKKVAVNSKKVAVNYKSGRELFFEKMPVNLASVRELFSKSVPFTFQQHNLKKTSWTCTFYIYFTYLVAKRNLRKRSTDSFYVPMNMVWPRVRSSVRLMLWRRRTTVIFTTTKNPPADRAPLLLGFYHTFHIFPEARRDVYIITRFWLKIPFYLLLRAKF